MTENVAPPGETLGPSCQQAQLLGDRAALPAATRFHGPLPLQHDLPEGVYGRGNTQKLLHRPETRPVLPLRRIQRSPLQRRAEGKGTYGAKLYSSLSKMQTWKFSSKFW